MYWFIKSIHLKAFVCDSISAFFSPARRFPEDLEGSTRSARCVAAIPLTTLSRWHNKSQLRKLRLDPELRLFTENKKASLPHSESFAFSPSQLCPLRTWHRMEIAVRGNSSLCCLDLREGKQCGGFHEAMEMSAIWRDGTDYILNMTPWIRIFFKWTRSISTILAAIINCKC